MNRQELQESFCSFEELDEGCQETWKEKGYSRGQYCHKQSFQWGFQEGVQWAESRILAKCETLENQNNA